MQVAKQQSLLGFKVKLELSRVPYILTAAHFEPGKERFENPRLTPSAALAYAILPNLQVGISDLEQCWDRSSVG
jgi:hypothetical protein